MKLTELYFSKDKKKEKINNKSKKLIDNPNIKPPESETPKFFDESGNYIGPYKHLKSVKFSEDSDIELLHAVLDDLHRDRPANSDLISFLEESSFRDLFDSSDINLLSYLFDEKIIELRDLKDSSSSNPLQRTNFYNFKSDNKVFYVQTWLWFKIHGKEKQDLYKYIDNIKALAEIDATIAEKVKKAKKDKAKLASVFKSNWNRLAEEILYRGSDFSSVDTIKDKVNSLKLEINQVDNNINNQNQKLSKKQALNNLINYKLTEKDLEFLKDIIKIKEREL